MSTILVVDDMAIFRDPIAASLRLAGYSTLAACDGEEALRVTRTKRPDLILLDMAMPKMDGLTFLKQLRGDPAIANTPVVLLTALSERKDILAAAALGVGDYLLKSRFRMKDLLERVQRQLDGRSEAKRKQQQQQQQQQPKAPVGQPTGSAPVVGGTAVGRAAPEAAIAASAGVAAGPLPRLLTRDDCVRRAEGIFQAKTLSGVVMQVIALANSPHGNVTELAGLIARDPMLSARVLQAANSAAYAAGRPVISTIPDAIRKVGCATVRNIAAALGVFDVMPESSADGFNPIRCWQHSFAVAQVCEHLMALRDPKQAGLAYVVGLCHDLAEIFIHTQFRAEYEQVLAAAAATGRPADQVAREMLGMSHQELVTTIFKYIGLPDTIRTPVEILHGPRPDRATNPLARVLLLAENYSNGILLASSPASGVAPLPQSVCEGATGSPDPAPPNPEMLRSEVICLTTMLARLSRGDEASLTTPLLRRSAVRLWLVREAGLSSFDPVEAALRFLASDVHVAGHLPDAGSLTAERPDALVVVTCSTTAAGFTQADIAKCAAALGAAGGGSAPGNGALPVLWISTSRSDASLLPDGPAPLVAPAPLAALAKFVEESAAHSTRAAVSAAAA